MKVLNRYSVEKLFFPVDGYTHIVKTLTSVDNGKTFYYCGNSRYFNSALEAEEYKNRLEKGETA